MHKLSFIFDTFIKSTYFHATTVPSMISIQRSLFSSECVHIEQPFWMVKGTLSRKQQQVPSWQSCSINHHYAQYGNILVLFNCHNIYFGAPALLQYSIYIHY
jgi:hypothetical protein